MNFRDEPLRARTPNSEFDIRLASDWPIIGLIDIDIQPAAA
jgi:hypothetical protein